MGLNFYHYYDGLQPKMSAGIINEHECTYTSHVIQLQAELVIAPSHQEKYGWDTWPSSSDPRSTPSVPAYYVNYFGIAHRLISMRIGLWNFLSIAIIFIWVLSLIYKKRASQLQLEQSQFFSSLLINIKVEQTMVNLW